jgi:hypothetical protein
MRPSIERGTNTTFVLGRETAGQRRQNGKDETNKATTQNIESAVIALDEAEKKTTQRHG